jgi:hypothetical protein
VGLAERKRTTPVCGDHKRRNRDLIYPGWQPRGDVGAIADSRLDEAIAEKMLVGTHDGVAPDTQLIGQTPARGQPQTGNESAIEDRATQTGVYLQRLIADGPV